MYNKSSLKKSLALTIGTLALCFFIVSVSFAAWQTQLSAPKLNEAPAPLNVSSNAQGKLGNVGIGMTTTPLTNLDVYNSSSASQYIRTDSSALKFVGTGGTNYIESGSSTTADSKADLKFTSMDGTTPFVTIQGSTGNVGIGTTSPAAKLDIVGAGGNNDLLVNGRIQVGDANGNGGIWLNGNTHDALVGNNGNNVGFWTNGTNVGWNAFQINKTNGYVGINTQTPTTNLDINGTIRIEGGTPAAGLVLISDANGLAHWGTCPQGTTGPTGPPGIKGPTGPQGWQTVNPPNTACNYNGAYYSQGAQCLTSCTYSYPNCSTWGSVENVGICNSDGSWSSYQIAQPGTCGCTMALCTPTN